MIFVLHGDRMTVKFFVKGNANFGDRLHRAFQHLRTNKTNIFIEK